MSDKIAKLLKNSPRVTLNNIKANPYSEKRRKVARGQYAKWLNKGKVTNFIKPRIGYDVDRGTRGRTDYFLKKIPKYGYNRDTHLKRDYQPLTLWTLQRMIDLGRIDINEPIDVTTLVNARVLKMEPGMNQYGIFLVEQGADIFEAKVNIEIQIANETSIAAIERNGGTITTAFYDLKSMNALCRPVEYFLIGRPIHKRLLPPKELVPYYTDPETRGYLSDPAKVSDARISLANKFGYNHNDVSEDEKCEMLMMKKDPRQVFFGLSPGWIVNLADRVVIKPEDEFIKKYLTL